MKLGSTEIGTGIVCENKTELALALSAIGDILDTDFWAKIEEECIRMSIGMRDYIILLGKNTHVRFRIGSFAYRIY